MANMTRAGCVLLFLAAAAKGPVASARSGSFFGLAPQPILQSHRDTARQWENESPMDALLRCRGGSDSSSAPAAAAAAVRGGGAACRGKQSARKGGLVAAVKSNTPWGVGQGRGAEWKASTELVSARGGANAAASADVSKEAYRSALFRTALLVCSAGAFGLGTWVVKGKTSALEFFAGYIVEQSLSVDNLFIFIMLFDYFKVPAEFQSRVLNWGIIGAVSMRAVMIVVGVAAIQRFRAVMLVFAGILVVSSIKLLMEGVEDDHADSSALEGNLVLKAANWMMDSTDFYDGEKFFTMVDGVKKATPLLLCLICIEMTDFVFAVDSIPAVLAISHDTFIVYASNVFAICAMRSIYTLVSHAISDLPYLKPAVALVLGFVGGKMFAEFYHYDIGVGVSLSVVCGILAIGAIASVISNKRRDAALASNASSVTGGGASGLTFESFSAAASNAEGEGGGAGGGLPGADAAAAAVAEAREKDIPGEARSAMEDQKSAAGERLAAAKDRAAAASATAADAAKAKAGTARDAAGEAVAEGKEGAAAAGEDVASAARGLQEGAADRMQEAGEAAESAAADVEEGFAETRQQVSDGIASAGDEGGGASAGPGSTEDGA